MINSIQSLKLGLYTTVCVAQHKGCRDIHGHDCCLEKAVS